ncbi:hypothetical protein NDU88_013233 [Pleurodeles waltl]|uniref:Uncharacterized protein n=1 Tax=Pleurodeles waltl TaxID=8319 RepID=A0AAV7R2K7_PLEWA|nr:hypothetical protein NDU88_013233 [Pleurodeles waltl]
MDRGRYFYVYEASSVLVFNPSPLCDSIFIVYDHVTRITDILTLLMLRCDDSHHVIFPLLSANSHSLLDWSDRCSDHDSAMGNKRAAGTSEALISHLVDRVLVANALFRDRAPIGSVDGILPPTAPRPRGRQKNDCTWPPIEGGFNDAFFLSVTDIKNQLHRLRLGLKPGFIDCALDLNLASLLHLGFKPGFIDCALGLNPASLLCLGLKPGFIDWALDLNPASLTVPWA